MGDGLRKIGGPERKEPGIPEGILAQPAITWECQCQRHRNPIGGCCAFRVPDRQARPLMGSGRETIEPMGKAHKRADSGVVVGNGARIRSLAEAWRRENKQAFVMLWIGGEGACSLSMV